MDCLALGIHLYIDPEWEHRGCKGQEVIIILSIDSCTSLRCVRLTIFETRRSEQVASHTGRCLTHNSVPGEASLRKSFFGRWPDQCTGVPFPRLNLTEH